MPSGSDVDKKLRFGKLQNFQFLFPCNGNSEDVDIVSLRTVAEYGDLKLCNYHMFRTINQTITAATLWREAFRKLTSSPEFGGQKLIILAHFGAFANTVNEQNTLDSNMQYLRILDADFELDDKETKEADRRRYYELTSEMSSLDYFHFSSEELTREDSAQVELCVA